MSRKSTAKKIMSVLLSFVLCMSACVCAFNEFAIDSQAIGNGGGATSQNAQHYLEGGNVRVSFNMNLSKANLAGSFSRQPGGSGWAAGVWSGSVYQGTFQGADSAYAIYYMDRYFTTNMSSLGNFINISFTNGGEKHRGNIYLANTSTTHAHGGKNYITATSAWGTNYTYSLTAGPNLVSSSIDNDLNQSGDYTFGPYYMGINGAIPAAGDNVTFRVSPSVLVYGYSEHYYFVYGWTNLTIFAIDTTALRAAISTTPQYPAAAYSNYATYQTALNNANAILSANSVTQTEINNATTALNNARAGLQLKTFTVSLPSSMLNYTATTTVASTTYMGQGYVRLTPDEAYNQSKATLSATNCTVTPISDNCWQITGITDNVQLSFSGVNINKYTVRFLNHDGSDVVSSQQVSHGSLPTVPDDLDRAADAQYSYAFDKWSPDVVVATGDADYYATYTNSLNSYVVSFKDGDGNELFSDTYFYGDTPEYDSTLYGVPTKTATDKYTYTWNGGWDADISEVTGTTEYIADFDSEINKYSVSFFDFNGDLLQNENLEYDALPVYDETNGIPSKPSDVQYDYTWSGWSPEIATVTGDISYSPVFDSTLRQYTVKFLDGDGNVLQQSKWDYGTVPSYDVDANGTPTKTRDVQYTYTWNNAWTEKISEVSGDVEYTADFDETVNQYTVSFYDYNGDLLQSGLWDYGATPVYDENANGTPVRAYDDDYHYVFEDEWDTAIADVTGDAEYTAVLTAVAHNYTNYVYNNDRTCDINGTHTGECVCGKTHTEPDPEYPSFGGVHLFTDYVYNDDATCLENGTETAHCDRCSVATDTREKADTALGHEFLETAYVSDGDATCLVDGHETAKCSRCDVTDTRIDVESALGHDFIDYTDNNNETCTLNATETGHCSRCDATNTRDIEGSALGHDYVATVIEPSCTGRGLTKHICSRCKDMYCDSYVDALGHDFGEWVTVNEATCTHEGTKERYCSRCDEVEKYEYEVKHTPSADDATICAFCGKKITTESGGTGGGSTVAGEVPCCESHHYPNTFWGRILAFICRIKQLFIGSTSFING